ncbi:MAG: MarR family transcriptional regulator [Hamadaea sp.]|nr:MarR family transcriptional regulator [Hamadaea sp.]
MASVTGRVRDFNRYYTQRIGVLTDRYLGQRPLGEARLLFEIGAAAATGDGTAEVGAVRARLGLDSGYASRLLRSLERQGLIQLRPDPRDARARLAVVTETGRKEITALDALSDGGVDDLLAPLTPGQRERLADAMGEIQRLLRAAAVTIRPVPAESAAGRSCLLAYAEELGHRFPEGYSASDLVAPQELDPPSGLLLVAADDLGDVACVGLRTFAPGVGEVRHMWVHPRARRTGLGRRLLAELEARALAMGLPELRLGTHESLPEAIAMYRALGYAETTAHTDDPHNQRFFVKRLS